MGTLEMLGTLGILGSVDPDPGIRAWIDAVSADDEGWSRHRALEGLRRRGTEGVRAIGRLYDARWEDDTLRTLLVQCAAELATVEAGAFLVEVLDAGIESYSSVETTRRVTALHGLTTLASTGDREAADAIARAMRHPLASVRYAAYATVRSLPDEIQRSAELRFGLLVLADEFRDLYEL